MRMSGAKMCFCLTCSSVHPKSKKPQGNF